VTEPHVLLVAAAAVCVALAAGWFAVGRAPALDGERWFKTLLELQLARHGWSEDRRRAVLPYHPAGRLVERKLEHPDLAAVDGSPVAGEQGLVTTLRALPTVEARWALWVGSAERDLRPEVLGSEHDPARWLGPGHGWGRAGEAGGIKALALAAESRQDARWVWVDGGPCEGVPDLTGGIGAEATVVPWLWGVEQARLHEALAAWGRSLRATAGTQVPWPVWAAVERIAERLGELVVATAAEGVRRRLWAAVEAAPPSRRLLVGSTGVGTAVLLRALVSDMDLRDRIVGVLAVGGVIGGWPALGGPVGEARCADWLGARFRHELLDTEIIRLIPYMAVQWVDPKTSPLGAGGLPVGAARFPEPQYVGGRFLQPKEAPSVEVVDLGVLVPDPDLPLEEVVDALRLVCALWSLTRR
jgi:hypothetical protein